MDELRGEGGFCARLKIGVVRDRIWGVQCEIEDGAVQDWRFSKEREQAWEKKKRDSLPILSSRARFPPSLWVSLPPRGWKCASPLTVRYFFLSFFFVFCFWPICDFVLDLLFAVAALCGFLLRRRGSHCCPLWVSSLPSWVSSLPFVGLRRLGPPLSWVSVEMREKEPEMRSRKSWEKKKITPFSNYPHVPFLAWVLQKLYLCYNT